MQKQLLAIGIAAVIAISSQTAMADPKGAQDAGRQQAVEHQREVQRMKENFKEHGSESRGRDDYSRGDPMERARDRNKKAEEGEAPEEDLDEDVDEDGVDSSE